MDVGGFLNGKERDRGLVLIWLVGVIAVCRGVLATLFPAIRSALNL